MPTSGFPIKLIKVKLLAGEQKATEFSPSGFPIWLWVNTNGIPFWGRCTTHFRTFLGGDWDVYWRYEILTPGHLGPCLVMTPKGEFFWFQALWAALPLWF